ncbi:hypothetical protein KKI93_25310, partial [Xenorhabdus bovienii]|uniref:condensation domain-containing protein n=1 Tax=Xenorhabdus bovienii TaxID=40576 RepID=UPI0023B30244
LWFLARLNPAASLAYHIPTVLYLCGQFNQAAFKRALDSLVTRQESLRTRFVLVDEQLYQHIDDADIGFTLNYQDLRGLNKTSCMNRIDELI